MMALFVGLDLGQSQDYTALAIAEQHSVPAAYDVRHLQRFALGTPYPDLVARVEVLMGLLPAGTPLVVDSTGVGAAVVDLLVRAKLSPISVTITSGTNVTRHDSNFRLPKRDLIACIQVLLQSSRLRISAALPEAMTLVQELLDFRLQITETGHDIYGARTGHDDLLTAAALAVWYAEHGRGLGAGVRPMMDALHSFAVARRRRDTVRDRSPRLYPDLERRLDRSPLRPGWVSRMHLVDLPDR
jgi:hypothetical protein